MGKNINDPQSVTNHIQKLDPALYEVVQAIRQLILSTDKEIGEQIKWNSPSFFYMGEMKPFDPKEYKRDIVVVNLHRGAPLLVFPTGAIVKDTTGLLEGDYKDGRRIIKFKDLNDVQTKGLFLQNIVKAWLELIDK